MASVSSLPVIKGSSPSRSSAQVVAEQVASLLRQVEYWHQMYLDSEASSAKQRSDEVQLLQKQLSGALDRERFLAAKNLELRSASQAKEAEEEEEARQKVALCEQLSSAHVMLQHKEEELQASRRQSMTRGEQVEKLRDDLQKQFFDAEQHKAMESEIADLQKRLEASLKKTSAKEHLCDTMDQELNILRSQLPAKEAELVQLNKDFDKKAAEAARAEQQQKSLQREVSDLQVRLDASLQKMSAKEQELQWLQAQLREKEDQFQDLQKCQNSTSAELAELRGKTEAALEAKDSEVAKLKGDLAKEQEVCHAAVSDNCELRQLCCDKLSALGEQEARHQRFVKFLEAEKEMWLNRSDHFEKLNSRLRLDLQKNLDVAEAEMTLTPTPPPRRPSTAGTYRDRVGRTLLQHRAEGKKSSDAEQRED
ncbi:unnamed protein product [Symbiodinium sp. CCMP2592]|nr:unnamed protein product [Symbiodinium sp. CCMP2592]